MNLNEIVGCLAHYRQRATYRAVAAAVGSPAIGVGVMQGRTKNYLNSWVVSSKKQQPTNYPSAQIDPELEHVPFVISDVDTLRRWLSTRLKPKDSAAVDRG